MMLETEEADDDFFTPVASTSLANIFGNSSQHKGSENEDLKNVPSKPTDITPKTTEDTKVSECVFACALTAYVWVDNVYTTKGKLGFAIVKIIKTNIHNIVLYDANKTTISSATVTSNLEITVKGNLYICYYDNLRNYWSLCGKEDDMKQIVEVLQCLNASMKFLKNVDDNLPELVTEKQKNQTMSNVPIDRKNESDTDSSLNRKTKESILHRMANMGQSVLPPQSIYKERTSDSSDSNEVINHSKPRYKPVKVVAKRLSADRSTSDTYVESVKTLQTKNEQLPNSPSNMYTLVDGQLMPVLNSSLIASPMSNNEMSLFITEQRISNSEIRININRTSDKLDQILDKLKGINVQDGNSDKSFQVEIMQKLLNEYENKVKMYEKHFNEPNEHRDKKYEDELKLYISRIHKLETALQEKNKEIGDLQIKYREESHKDQQSKNSLEKEIKSLKEALALNEKEIGQFSSKMKQNTADNKLADHVKSVMNETFRKISANFESDKRYTGEEIKNIIGSMIKKTTIESLQKCSKEQ